MLDVKKRAGTKATYWLPQKRINVNVEIFTQKVTMSVAVSALQDVDPGQHVMEYRAAVVDLMHTL